LALLPNGSVDDLTDETPESIAALRAMAPGIRIEEREGYKVVRYLVTAAHVLEGPVDWPGRLIPIIPVVGEEKQIGRKVVRRGLIRSAKDSQRMFNYFCSAQSEVVGLQPKAPFIGTEENFRNYLEEWSRANRESLPFLPYKPDPLNNGMPPQRVQPPVSSQGITEGLTLALENMKGTIGIYDAGLGNRSNETSGRAILARQREGDIGTLVYIDNWVRAIKHVAKVLIELIPYVYDTERMIRIMGEDGKIDLTWINRPVGIQEIDPETGEAAAIQRIENDVTVGAYDVVIDMGPSYTTKREEAKESMREFIQNVSPEYIPAIADLYAKAQDWPNADEIARRMETLAPPPIQRLIAQQKKELGPDEQLPEPTPEEQMQAQMQQAAAELELQAKVLGNEKIKAEIAKTMKEASGEEGQTAATLEAQKAAIELQMKQVELEAKRQLAAIDIQIKLAELGLKRAGMAQKAEQHALDTALRADRHFAQAQETQVSGAAANG
jgi:hypothetical protein